jgi:hypothetical protein
MFVASSSSLSLPHIVLTPRSPSFQDNLAKIGQLSLFSFLQRPSPSHATAVLCPPLVFAALPLPHPFSSLHPLADLFPDISWHFCCYSFQVYLLRRFVFMFQSLLTALLILCLSSPIFLTQSPRCDLFSFFSRIYHFLDFICFSFSALQG